MMNNQKKVKVLSKRFITGHVQNTKIWNQESNEKGLTDEKYSLQNTALEVRTLTKHNVIIAKKPAIKLWLTVWNYNTK